MLHVPCWRKELESGASSQHSTWAPAHCHTASTARRRPQQTDVQGFCRCNRWSRTWSRRKRDCGSSSEPRSHFPGQWSPAHTPRNRAVKQATTMHTNRTRAQKHWRNAAHRQLRAQTRLFYSARQAAAIARPACCWRGEPEAQRSRARHIRSEWQPTWRRKNLLMQLMR